MQTIADHERPSKRRKVLSCNDCRRRKQKCDRAYPACGRCQGAGLADTCTYDKVPQSALTAAQVSINGHGDNAVQQSALNHASSSIVDHANLVATHNVSHELQSQKLQIASLERRLSSLEKVKQNVVSERVNQAHRVNTPAGNQNAQISTPFIRDYRSTPAMAREAEQIFFRGKGFKTEFYGATSPWCTVPSLRTEVRPMMKNADKGNRTLSYLRNVLEALGEKFNLEKEQAKEVRAQTDYLKLLPERNTLDQLLAIHFETFGTTYRVLHGPTFWATYDRFCDSPSSADTSFVITLLLCAASVRCAYRNEPLQMIGDGSTAGVIAEEWIQACDAWIKEQSSNPSELSDYQLRCLLMLAKKANFIKTKNTWKDAGALLQYGLAAGLHRDPVRLLGPSTTFEQEMRRRIWVTMLNLELEVSIERGMPAMSTSIYKDCDPPLNIDDEEFGESSQFSLVQHPSEQYSSSSFLHLTMNSINLRTSLNALLNNSTEELGYDRVLVFHTEISQQLSALPKWSKGAEERHSKEESMLPKIMLDIQLRQFLIFLHARYLHLHEYSRMACLDAATTIVDYYDELEKQGNYGLVLMRRDVLRSALCICQIAMKRGSSPAFEHYLIGNLETRPSKTLMASAFYQVEQALTFFERKIMRSGHGLRSYWLLLAACDMMRRRTVIDLPNSLQQPVMERLTAMYRKMLELQKDVAERDALTSGQGISHGTEMASEHSPQCGKTQSCFDPTESIHISDQLFTNFEMPDWMYEDLQLFTFDNDGQVETRN